MDKLITLFGLMFVWVGISAQDGFIKYIDLQNRFEVEAPGYFKYNEKTFSTQAGKVTHESFSLKKDANHPNSLYLINTVNYEEGYFNQDSLEFIEEYLENNVINVAEANKCKIVYATLGRLAKGTPMINFRLEGISEDKIVKGAFYIKDNTIFGVQVFTTKKASMNHLIDRFMQSFTLEKDIPDVEIIQSVKKKKQSALKKIN